MGNKIYSIVYGGSPYQPKEVEGEYFGIDGDGTLRVYDADRECIIAFASIVWAYIENVTLKMHKEENAFRDKFRGLKPAKND